MYDIIKTWRLHLKRKLKKKLKGTGIRRASKEMFFAMCFIQIAHTHKRHGEQIDGSILKELFLACFIRTLHRDLC